jgi:hypothetical protein
MVKWFPGINMYKTLGMVADSGMNDAIKLLILAGNDIRFLERKTSLSRLMSKISILYSRRGGKTTRCRMLRGVCRRFSMEHRE